MSIALFAMIGVKLNLGTAYWILFSIYGFLKVAKAIYETIQNN